MTAATGLGRAPVNERLDVEKEREIALYYPSVRASAVDAMASEIYRLRTQRDAVLALHHPQHPIGTVRVNYCAHCAHGSGYPCPTVRALAVSDDTGKDAGE